MDVIFEKKTLSILLQKKVIANYPPYEQLKDEVAKNGYEYVGRRYGVTGKAVSKRLKSYEKDLRKDMINNINSGSGGIWTHEDFYVYCVLSAAPSTPRPPIPVYEQK